MAEQIGHPVTLMAARKETARERKSQVAAQTGRLIRSSLITGQVRSPPSRLLKEHDRKGMSALLVAGMVLVGSCAHHRRQVAFGVAAEALRAFANATCVVVDVKVSNVSARPAFLLTHPEYPHVRAFTDAEDVRLSLHELPAHRLLDPHKSSPQGVRLPARGALFLRMRLGLPLRVPHPGDEEYAKDVASPRFVRVAVGIVGSSGAGRLAGTGGLHDQGIAETESIRVERRPNSEPDCESMAQTITRRDPAEALRPSDRVLEF